MRIVKLFRGEWDMDASLVRLKQDQPRKSAALKDQITVIGRRKICDLRIPIISVSRKHCQLHQQDGLVKIADLDSKNGTFLNGSPITEATLKAGDILSVGPVRLMLRI